KCWLACTRRGNRAVILLEHVIQIRHLPMPAILGQTAFGFELRDGGRVRGVAIGVDHSWHRMVRTAEGFEQKALGPDSVLFGREEKIQGRSARVHRPVKVTPLALNPDVGQSPRANCRWSV